MWWTNKFFIEINIFSHCQFIIRILNQSFWTSLTWFVCCYILKYFDILFYFATPYINEKRTYLSLIWRYLIFFIQVFITNSRNPGQRESDWWKWGLIRIVPELIVTFFRFKLVFDLAGAVDGLWRICDRSEVVDGREGFSSSTYNSFHFDPVELKSWTKALKRHHLKTWLNYLE